MNYEQLKTVLVQDYIFSLAVILLIENITYLLSSKILLAYYQKQTSRLKDFNRSIFSYRILDKSYISNYPSQTAKKFFVLQNKITLSFNYLIGSTFIVYLFLIFFR